MDESRASNLRDFSILSGEPAPGADSIADGNGEPLFVINLCAAMTPINLEDQALAGLNQYKLYQVSRMEDGRRRYRLRLGFFTTEAHAEDILSSVRARYATAFTSCLCEEDLKHATGYLKCSVKDLERTGRYAVQKLRGDSGATTAVRAIDATALQQLQSAQTQRDVALSPAKAPAPLATVSPIRTPANPQRAATLANPVVETSWQPERTQPVVSAPKPRAAPPPVAKTPASAISASAPITPKPAPLAEPLAPARESLMRRAHAMAPMDAVDRAKAVPGSVTASAFDTAATGKFKLPDPVPKATPKAPPATTQAATPKIAAPKIAAPVVPTMAAASTVAPRMHSSVRPTNTLPTSARPAMQPTAQLEAHTPPAHAANPPVHNRNQAFHVGAGVNIPETTLSLAPSDLPAQVKVSVTPSVTKVSPVASPAIDTSTTTDLLRARELAKQSSLWRQENGEIPTLDTTQTIRTLTKNELDDANRPKWFTVQLAISDHPANLDTMPKLDIFEAYSLYSVATMEGSGIRHALRLGFFREAVSAEAVMGYLKTFFNEPTIVRIPDAEHDRFIDAPKISASTKPAAHAAVVLEQKSPVKPIPMTVPTVNATVQRTASMTPQIPKQPPRTMQPAKPMARAAAPATKRAATPMHPVNRKPAKAPNLSKEVQQELIDEACLLGLSDTAILRVQKNPSLLSRLVGKLGK